MRITSTICAMLAAIALPTAVSAQNTDPLTLTGLRSLAIVIADLDDEDLTNCGVARTGLYTSLRGILAQSDMVIVDNAQAGDGIIYLQATVLSNCAANIVLNVQTSVTINKTGTRVLAPVWERARLRTGFSGRAAGAAIRQSVEETAKLLVADWSTVNK